MSSNTTLGHYPDFYSLFGAFAELMRDKKLPTDLARVANQLGAFLESLEDDEKRLQVPELGQYYEAARSATNDPGPRQKRISVIKKIILGEKLNGSDK